MSKSASTTRTSKPQSPDLATVLKTITGVFGSMAVVFGVLNMLSPISVLQPLIAIAIGLAVAGTLMRAYHLSWQVPVISWLVVSGIGVIIYLVVSRPAMVSGSMVDGSAQARSGLTVILNDSGGVDHKAITDKDGLFVITNIPEGRYTITVDGKFVRGGNVPSGWSRLLNTVVDIGSAVAVPCAVNPCPAPPPTPTMLSGSASDWQTYVDKDQSGSSISVKPVDSAIEVSFDLINDGYVGIKKVLPPKALSGTTGIRFSYQGRGQPNTIEVKLIYKAGTVFWVWLRHASITGGYGWVTREISYDRFRCSAGSGSDPDKCPPSGGEPLRLDLEKVETIEFAISNKTRDPNNPEDTEPSADVAGSGTVTIKDVQAVK